MDAIMIGLKCITNMHVGNGEANYSIIDNAVEKDSVTGYPTIHSSGIKGALREYFSDDADLRDRLFGAQVNNDSRPGAIKILAADMLAKPGRASKGNEAYYLVTTDTMLQNLKDKIKTFLNKDWSINKNSVSNVEVEGINLTEKVDVVEELFGKQAVYLVSEEQMNTIDLPVLARNKLDNGISQNLWYEEVVPHQSLFTFVVVGEKKDLDDFCAKVKDKVVQFGGNASIGYGLCKVTVME